MMRLIFLIKLVEKLQIFAKFWQIIHELILSYQQFNYLINNLINYHRVRVLCTDWTCILFKIKLIILSWILLCYLVIININFYVNLLHFQYRSWWQSCWCFSFNTEQFLKKIWSSVRLLLYKNFKQNSDKKSTPSLQSHNRYKLYCLCQSIDVNKLVSYIYSYIV